jgi:hypothetical protein
MRKTALLISVMAVLLLMCGCKTGNVIVYVTENGYIPGDWPVANIILEWGVTYEICNSTGAIIHSGKFDLSSPKKVMLELEKGLYTAKAECQGHKPVEFDFVVEARKEMDVKLNFKETMFRGRVRSRGEIPPDTWRDDIVVDLYKDVEGIADELLASTGVDEKGEFTFVVDPDIMCHPQATVIIGDNFYGAGGFVRQYPISEILLWDIMFESID